MIDLLLRDTSRGDIGIDGGFIVAAAEAREVRDLGGRLVTPPLVEPHIHLDAVLTVGQPRPNV
jgi:cytosine/creatinine deaminase